MAHYSVTHTSSQRQQLVLQHISGICALIHQIQFGDNSNGSHSWKKWSKSYLHIIGNWICLGFGIWETWKMASGKHRLTATLAVYHTQLNIKYLSSVLQSKGTKPTVWLKHLHFSIHSLIFTFLSNLQCLKESTSDTNHDSLQSRWVFLGATVNLCPYPTLHPAHLLILSLSP